VPQTVTIPAGQTSVTFPVGTIILGIAVGTPNGDIDRFGPQQWLSAADTLTVHGRQYRDADADLGQSLDRRDRREIQRRPATISRKQLLPQNPLVVFASDQFHQQAVSAPRQ